MRHGSFSGASQALHISPQAVSQQIHLLEDSLKITLFTRQGRHIQPTEQATLLAPFVHAAFDELHKGVHRVSQAGDRFRININVSPYFAMHYLMARLERFRERMPGTDLRLTTLVTLPDFAADDVDVSIQWGFGHWRHLDARLLVRDPKVICCAPSLADRITCPQDLLQFPLLHPVVARNLWSRVLTHLGVDSAIQDGDIQLQDATTMRQATGAGMGVGLVSEKDARADLAAGRLAAPLGLDALHDMDPADIPGFYLVLPSANKRIPIVEAFCEWALAQAWDDEAHYAF